MTVGAVVAGWLRPESAVGYAARRWYRAVVPNPDRPAILRLIDSYAIQRRRGVRFVQVGSNDASAGDPLRHHILRRHWVGLMVEPVPDVFDRLRRSLGDRPGLEFECAAVTNFEGRATFYALRPRAPSEKGLPPWYDQIGSFSLEHVLRHADRIPNLRERVVEIDVPCLPFGVLCDRHGVDGFDLLHVDAEGHDAEILRGVDLERHDPDLILFEHVHLSTDDLHTTEQRLESAGYGIVRSGPDTLAVAGRLVADPTTRIGRTWSRIHTST